MSKVSLRRTTKLCSELGTKCDLSNLCDVGGMYTSPEFQIGQVYDGTMNVPDDVVLYRPVYVKVLPQISGAGGTKPIYEAGQQANGSPHNPVKVPTSTTAEKASNRTAEKQHLLSTTSVDNPTSSSATIPASSHNSGGGENEINANEKLSNPSRVSKRSSATTHHHQAQQQQLQMTPPKSKRQLDAQNSREQLLPQRQQQVYVATSSSSTNAKKPSLSQEQQQQQLRRRMSSERKSSLDVDEDRDIRLALHDTRGQPEALARESSTGYLEPTSAAALAATCSGNAVNGNNTLANSNAGDGVTKQHRHHRQVENNDSHGSGDRARGPLVDSEGASATSTAAGTTSNNSAQRVPLVASTSRSSASSAHKSKKSASHDDAGSRHMSRL